MAHELFGERFYGKRIPAWHGLGKVFKHEPTAVEAFEEAGFAELFGVPADGGGVPCVGGGLCHGVGQRGGGVFREEVAGLSGEYGFEEAAAAVCDDWFSACLGFEGDDAEVFFAGENQEAAAAVQGADVFVGDASDKFDVGGGDFLEGGFFGAGAGDFQGVAGLGVGLDGEVHPFVGDERGDDEVEAVVSAAFVGCEVAGGDGGIDDGGVAVVKLLDAGLDVAADGYEVVHAAAGGFVPAAQALEDDIEQGAFDAAAAEVFRLQGPGVAHGGEAVAEVSGAGGGADAFGYAVAGADDEVGVGGQAEGFDGAREEGEEPAVVALKAGDAREAGDVYAAVADGVGDLLGLEEEGV